MNNFKKIYSLLLWNLFETEIVANEAVIPIRNLLSINKFLENGEVFINFSTSCWYSDFLNIVSLTLTKLPPKQSSMSVMLGFQHKQLFSRILLKLHLEAHLVLKSILAPYYKYKGIRRGFNYFLKTTNILKKHFGQGRVSPKDLWK